MTVTESFLKPLDPREGAQCPLLTQVPNRSGLTGFVAHDISSQQGTRQSTRRTQFLFDPEQLIVLGNAIGSAGRATLDLSRPATDCQVGDERVLGFARAMRDHRCESTLVCQLNGSQGLGESPNLIQLD